MHCFLLVCVSVHVRIRASRDEKLSCYKVTKNALTALSNIVHPSTIFVLNEAVSYSVQVSNPPDPLTNTALATVTVHVFACSCALIQLLLSILTVLRSLSMHFVFQSVFKSDLLRLNLTSPLKSDAEVDCYFDSLCRTDTEECVQLDSFVAESCHVVVFSLLLEYLPTSQQRVACCQTAWKLLVVDGLLVIVTPDSRQQHRNHRFTRNWRKTIESIGFSRCRYEKLEHLHCMAFRRLAKDDCQLTDLESIDDALCIPQDHDNDNCADDMQSHVEQIYTTTDASVGCSYSESYIDLSSELPGMVSD